MQRSSNVLALVLGLLLSTFTVEAALAAPSKPQILGDINTALVSASMSKPVPFGSNTFLFSRETKETGSELWITDGTTAGTQLVKDIRPGAASSNPTAGGIDVL